MNIIGKPGEVNLVCMVSRSLRFTHYRDIIMGAVASQITSLTIVSWAVYSDADQRKHQSSASLAFVRGIHRGPVNSPHKWPVTRKCFHLMTSSRFCTTQHPHIFAFIAILFSAAPSSEMENTNYDFALRMFIDSFATIFLLTKYSCHVP